MSEFLLSPVEVADLTGATYRSRQTRWLRENGYPFEIGADGKVKVLRAAVDARMMPSHARAKAKTEPNLTLLKKAS